MTPGPKPGQREISPPYELPIADGITVADPQATRSVDGRARSARGHASDGTSLTETRRDSALAVAGQSRVGLFAHGSVTMG